MVLSMIDTPSPGAISFQFGFPNQSTSRSCWHLCQQQYVINWKVCFTYVQLGLLVQYKIMDLICRENSEWNHPPCLPHQHKPASVISYLWQQCWIPHYHCMNNMHFVTFITLNVIIKISRVKNVTQNFSQSTNWSETYLRVPIQALM